MDIVDMKFLIMFLLSLSVSSVFEKSRPMAFKSRELFLAYDVAQVRFQFGARTWSPAPAARGREPQRAAPPGPARTPPTRRRAPPA